MLLDKAVALITGGAQGFGKEFARSLLKKGVKVVIADVNTELGEKFQQDYSRDHGNDKLKFIKCDVTNQEELYRTFEDTHKLFGGLDIVCNNAGIMTTDVKRARQQVNINLTAVIEGTYKAVDMMSKKNGGNGGVIVNVASAAGFQLMPGAAVYTATKHAVVAFTRSFKHLQHLSEDNIRVNCICPFFCETEMVRKGYEEQPGMKEAFASVGLLDIADVAKAFMNCIEDENMNATAVAIKPPKDIFTLSFPPAQPKASL